MSANPAPDEEPQIIRPSNNLKMKVGGSLKGLDMKAVEKAEQALQGLSNQFGAWLQEEIDKLDRAYEAVKATGLDEENVQKLYLCSHDLKGLAATYEYPVITRIAGTLCKLIDKEGKSEKAPLVLVEAHVQAIKACVRDNMRDESNPVVKVLVAELDKQVYDLVGDID